MPASKTDTGIPRARGEQRRCCRRISALRAGVQLGAFRYAVHRVAMDELPPGQEVAAHAHSHFEAFVLLDGALEHEAEGVVRTFPAGSAILHTPSAPHATTRSHGRCLTFVLDFTCYPAPPPGPVLRWAHWPDLAGDVAGLLREPALALPGWEARCEFRLATLISRLMSLLDAPPRRDGEEVPGDLVGLIDQYLRAHLAEKLTLARLAEAAGMSERSLVRHFRRQAGATVHAYLARLRMDLAGRLLIDQPDLPLHEIAPQVGIPDASYFARLFRRHHRHTPHQHREWEAVRRARKR